MQAALQHRLDNGGGFFLLK